MHRIAVVAVPPVGTFELSIPDLVFGGVCLDGRAAYDVYTCTTKPQRSPALGDSMTWCHTGWRRSAAPTR
jgi:hypothetical protein